ncbi:hypothetical protein YC2023_075923 [Brassica napus]
MFSLSSPLHLHAGVSLHLKEPIIFRTSNSFRQLELKPAATVRSLYNVFENQDKPKDIEADRKVKEEERRRKIGLANKGKIPWNKGRRHTEDTRRRIKERTIEALRNPKVRDKIDETKEKIRASVKQVWAERSRSKRVKEKFISLWSENIAEAARKGGSGDVELDWDSYKKSKQEISSEQLQLSEEKARTREQTKMRTEEAKTEKMRRVVERKKERQERDERGVKTRKPKQNKENAIVTSRSKLKNRLTKIHKKKTSLAKVAIVKDSIVSVAAKLENLDLELIKKERTRGEISLADQIQAAKSLRGNDILSRVGLFAMKSMDFD